MSAKIASTTVSGLARLARIAPRERGSENQMVMFTTISVAALAFMMLLPSPRAAFGATNAQAAPVEIAATEKAGRLPVASETDKACAGQTWGAETLDCIMAITKANGMNKPVRMAAAGRQD